MDMPEHLQMEKTPRDERPKLGDTKTNDTMISREVSWNVSPKVDEGVPDLPPTPGPDDASGGPHGKKPSMYDFKSIWNHTDTYDARVLKESEQKIEPQIRHPPRRPHRR